MTCALAGYRFFYLKKQNHKPVSRILYLHRVQASVIYLARPLARRVCAAYPPCRLPYKRRASRAVPLKVRTQGILGIATRKVYPSCLLPGRSVRSYRTFSPLPRRGRAVIFCDTFYAAPSRRKAQLRRLGGAVLCVVRTFLPAPTGVRAKATEQFVVSSTNFHLF